MIRYPTLSELIYINGKVLNNPLILSGKQKIRDQGLLEAAAARPAASAFGQDAYLTLNEKVAALAHSLARNHPFTDGNKRTAVVAAIFMFQVNGWQVVWQPEEALSVILAVTEGQYDVASLAEWFPLRQDKASYQASAEQDMLSISHIMDDHRWLLDELSKR